MLGLSLIIHVYVFFITSLLVPFVIAVFCFNYYYNYVTGRQNYYENNCYLVIDRLCFFWDINGRDYYVNSNMFF